MGLAEWTASSPARDAAAIEASVHDPERFSELFDRHAPTIHRYLARRVGRDLADDLLTEAFLAAFAKRARFDPTRGEVGAWLYGFAATQLSRHRRDEARLLRLNQVALVETPASIENDIVDWVSAQQSRGALVQALVKLNPREREVLLLWTWEDLTYEQIALALDIPIGTVRSRLSRARAKVVAQLPPTPRLRKVLDD